MPNQDPLDALINTLKVLEDFGVKKSLKFEEIYNLINKTKDRLKEAK